MRWPGRIPRGRVCRELASVMDIFPTLSNLAGARLPDDREMDGRDIWPLMTGTAGAKSPHECYFYYDQGRLEGVRSGKWKLHRLKKDKWCLYDLESDIAEQADVSQKHPEIVAKLEQYLERARKELGDERTGQTGQGVRPLGNIGKSKRPT